MFGTDGSVTVGDQRWNRDGTYRGRLAWPIAGQVRPVALAGTSTFVVVGWDQLDGMPQRPAGAEEDSAWLLVADGGAKALDAATAVAIDASFSDNTFQVSPDGAAIVIVERHEITVRAIPSGTVLARTPFERPSEHDVPSLACWIDTGTIAWTASDGRALHALSIHDGKSSTRRLVVAGSIVACDPAGGTAALRSSNAIGVLDLRHGAEVGRVAIADEDLTVAIADRRLAIASVSQVQLFHRDGATLTPLFTHTLQIAPAIPPQLAFSLDGSRLAITDMTLVVIGPSADAMPAPIMPRVAFEVPRTFEPATPQHRNAEQWGYAQLPRPTKMATLPALLVDATSTDESVGFAHVMAIAVARDELPQAPGLDATDSELAAFAKRAMARLFDTWDDAKIGTGRDAELTLRVGRTNGRPWFETRELGRDGCEPYDAYTRVVIVDEIVFIIRAVVEPHASTTWLPAFFDVPFTGSKTAHRAAP